MVGGGGKIAFTSVAAKQAYDRGKARWEESNEAVGTAMKAWSGWNNGNAKLEKK